MFRETQAAKFSDRLSEGIAEMIGKRRIVSGWHSCRLTDFSAYLLADTGNLSFGRSYPNLRASLSMVFGSFFKE